MTLAKFRSLNSFPQLDFANIIMRNHVARHSRTTHNKHPESVAVNDGREVLIVGSSDTRKGYIRAVPLDGGFAGTSLHIHSMFVELVSSHEVDKLAVERINRFLPH